jgi:hypothetical protein
VEVGRSARLAFLLQVRQDKEEEEFFNSLSALGTEFARLAGDFDVSVRVGTRHPASISSERPDSRVAETAGAVEVSVPEARLETLPQCARSFGPLLAAIADTERSIVAAGPVHHIVEPKKGALFLSVVFRRHSSITPEQFHEWWLNQHAPLATSFLLPEMLAYDQVHLRQDLSEHASIEARFAYHRYDAYDNLTWADYESSLRSVSKPGLAEAMSEDDHERIDRASYVGTNMSVIQEVGGVFLANYGASS